MKLSDIVEYIFVHARATIGSWDPVLFEVMTRTELTDDGFRIVATTAPEYWVGMKDFQGTILVQAHATRDHHSCVAINQIKARAIYDQVVNSLLTT